MVHEQLLYIIYIYSIVGLSIKIKPSSIVLFVFYFYVFVSTYITYGNCFRHYSKYVWIQLYSMYCTLVFYSIHIGYHKYGYKYIFCTLPFFYFISIKLFEYYFHCENAIIHFIDDVFRYILSFNIAAV